MVYQIARELYRILDQAHGFKPVMIRTGDYYISLRGRTAKAKKAQADLFVSIHADAFTRKSARGASVFALSTRGATSETARMLADAENQSDLVGGVGGVSLKDKDEMLQKVLIDMSLTASIDSSMQVGHKVLREMGGVARLHKRRVEQAGFVVLKSDIPSILVETGFISNPEESRKLATSSYQKKMARAIHSGIKDWFMAHPPSGTLIAWQKQQGGRQYVIARGDTLSGIAARFNVPLSDLKRSNGLSGSKIMVGQKLVSPTT